MFSRGILYMQNNMVWGRGKAIGRWGKKIKNGVAGVKKIKKREGTKSILHNQLGKILNIFTYPLSQLCTPEKKWILKVWGGGVEMHNIYP